MAENAAVTLGTLATLDTATLASASDMCCCVVLFTAVGLVTCEPIRSARAAIVCHVPYVSGPKVNLQGKHKSCLGAQTVWLFACTQLLDLRRCIVCSWTQSLTCHRCHRRKCNPSPVAVARLKTPPQTHPCRSVLRPVKQSSTCHLCRKQKGSPSPVALERSTTALQIHRRRSLLWPLKM